MKAPIFNYTVKHDKGKKTCVVNIDGQIVDAETKQLYDMYFGDTALVSFQSFRNEIDAAIQEGCKSVDVWTNSVGGSVTEAVAMDGYLNSIVQQGISVRRITNGIAASAATLFNGGSGSFITKGSWYMIHNASGAIWGNVNDIENYAASMRVVNDDINKRYCDRTGLSKTVIGNMMDSETWITAEDAVKMGFVESLFDDATSSNVTNSNKQIKPENWLFQNTQVLAAYNSAIQNPLNMDFKNLINDIKDAFSNSLKEAGILKDENTKLAEQVTNALDAAFAPMNDGLNKAIDETVEARLKDLDSTITNKVNEAIQAANQNGLTETALEEKLKPINDSIKEIENKLTSGAGSAGSGSGNAANNGKVDVHNHPGVTW